MTGRILALEEQLRAIRADLLAYRRDTDKQNDDAFRLEAVDVVAREALKTTDAVWHAAIRDVKNMRQDQQDLELNMTKLESSFRKHKGNIEERLSHSERRLDKFTSVKLSRHDENIASLQCDRHKENLGFPGSISELATDLPDKIMNRLKHVAKTAAQDVLATTQCCDGVAKSLRGLESRLLACEPRSRRARWLWRSGDTSQGGWVPWEFEALNSSPKLFAWRPTEASHVTTTRAGLYRVSVGIFTHNHATVQLCIQGEPVLTLEPRLSRNVYPPQRCDVDDTIILPKVADEYIHCGANALYESHALRRSQHSAGQITCLAIDEFLALPALCDIAVRFDTGLASKDPARQAFLAITKI